MRILVTCALIVAVAAGLVTGAVAGKAIAGSGVLPQTTGSQSGDLGFEDVVGSTSFSAANASIQAAPSAGTGTSLETSALPQNAAALSQIGEPFPSSGAPSLPLGSDSDGVASVPLTSHPQTSAPGSSQFVQASRQVPGALDVRLIAAGDVNQDGVVDFWDLFLVNRAMDGLPITDGFIADQNGDKVINVLDLALVALRIGTALQS